MSETKEHCRECGVYMMGAGYDPLCDSCVNGSHASSCSADFDAEKKAIEFQELFFPKAGKLVRTAVRFSFAQGFRMAQKQND